MRQADILFALHEYGPMSAHEIEDRMNVSRTDNIYKQLKGMSKYGQVRIFGTKHDENGRPVTVWEAVA